MKDGLTQVKELKDKIHEQYMEIQELNKARKFDIEYNKYLQKEIIRLNNIIENLTTMTVNGDRTQIKNTAQYKIDKAIEYLESYNIDFKHCKFGEAPISMRELGDLLDILKGVDKE